MKCPNCRHENPEDAVFCNGCGQKLELACPGCKKINPPGSRFCNVCGQELGAPKEPTPIDYAQPQSYTPKHLADKILNTRSTLEGEHKLVTVIFADVAGFTSLSERLEPEEVHHIMEGCLKILMDDIHKYEGTINQFTGDGVMALFGAPIALEDGPQRAIRASLTILRELVQFNDKMRREKAGDTVNLASRMEGLAEPGLMSALSGD